MRDIRIAICGRCVRSVGDNKAPETWPFSMEFVPEGEPEDCEWGRKRGSLHPLQMGAGVRSLLLKRQCLIWLESRRMRWAGHVARMGEERKVYRVLVGKPKGKRPQGRPRRRWEDGIRMDLREIGLGGVDWIRLSKDRDRWRAVVSAVMILRVLAPRS
jgi:hypothetical protein